MNQNIKCKHKTVSNKFLKVRLYGLQGISDYTIDPGYFAFENFIYNLLQVKYLKYTS